MQNYPHGIQGQEDLMNMSVKQWDHSLERLSIVLLLYLGLLFVSIGVLPWKILGASDVPVALASQQFLGTFGPTLISWIIVLALPATCNAFIITISRTAFAMGRNGMLPKAIACIHPRFQTPIWAITLGVGIQVLFTLVSSINIAVTATGFLYLLTFIFTMIAFFISRKSTSKIDSEKQFFVPFYPVIPILALLISVSLLIPVGSTGFLTGLIWLSIGFEIYLVRMRAIKTTNQVETSP